MKPCLLQVLLPALFLPLLSYAAVVYPYRFDPADHPDNALRHYPVPDWESMGGRFHAPANKYIGPLHKITRIAGIDKNSFEANLDLEAKHAEINAWRKEYGGGYIGSHVGESDAGWVHFNHRYTFPFSRARENHYLSFADFLDAYGRITDYQLSWGNNLGLAHAACAQGYVTKISHQSHHTQFYQVVNSAIRGASKQYGVLFWGGLTDTYGKITDAFKKKNFETYEKAKKKLEETPKEERNWKDEFDVKAALRRATSADDPDGSPYGYSWRFWHTSYQYGMSGTKHLEGLEYRDYKSSMGENVKTELGLLYDQFEERLLNKKPNPGGMAVSVAFMLDFFNGWVGRDLSSAANDADGIVWDTIPFDHADYQLGNFYQLVYPGFQPLLSKKEVERIEGGFSETPYGDCADLILSDARPELLEQYGLIVLSGEYRSELTLLRNKLNKYLKQGGTVFACAAQAEVLWPELDVASGKIAIGSSESAVYEFQVGNGVLAVAASPYGLVELANPPEGSYDLGLYESVKEYLGQVLNDLKLFSVGDNLGYIVNRNAEGIYTLGIYNGGYHSLPFSIESHIGKIESIREIDTGEVKLIQADARYYAPQEVRAGSWGSSDDERIAGGDVRLFEIKVEEQGVKILDKADYPERPRRLLAMKMKNLRRNIQLMPSFFQMFSGVKLEGGDLLATDDLVLDYEYGWYKVRRLEMLVNGRAVKDEATQLALIEKMRRLPFAENLIVISPSTNVVKAATDAGIKLHSGPEAYQWLYKSEAPDDRTAVLDLEYEDWDDICADVLKLEQADSVQLAGMPLKTSIPEFGSAKPGRPYLALRNIDSLFSWLSEHPGFFDHFSGVVLESNYLLQLSEPRVVEGSELLRRHNIGVIIDFTDKVKMYRDIGYQSGMPFADMGRRMYENVLSKMSQASFDTAIMAGPQTLSPSHDPKVKDAEASLKWFAEKAANYGVDLHMRPIFGFESDKKMRAALKKAGADNLHAAANPLVGKVRESTLLLLSKPDENKPYVFPFAGERITGLPAGSTVVFDAEYLNWEELMSDLEWWNDQI